MYESCLENQVVVKKLFATCATEEDKYERIIELGRSVRQLAEEYRVDGNLVPGCQSLMYMRSYMQGGKVFFEVSSDALISLGLAAIMLKIYNGETPEAILKCPPECIQELGINASLTPGRANGLYSIHLRMKQDALRYLVEGASN